MNPRILPLTDHEMGAIDLAIEDSGLGALSTSRGNLPLHRVDIRVDIVGVTSHVELTQEFSNSHDEVLEATYIFPIPDRSAVTRMRMVAADRVIEAELRERQEARDAYDTAIAAGQRASIAEEERPDVFTMRVGNILPGERVSVILSVAGILPVEDSQATFRFPLVVAPRYIPGSPLPGDSVGEGRHPDTDAVPDASRITPPVLLPGFPHPVQLSVDVGIDPAGLPMGQVRSSLHTVTTHQGRIRIQPGERLNRDFILRIPLEASEESASLMVVPDAEGEEGTYQLTVLPPPSCDSSRPRDVVLLLDRSGSMQGWAMIAARRAAARIIDTLTSVDRFAVLAFDHVVQTPPHLPEGLVPATDRHRYRAVEHVARMEARGGTELLDPLRRAWGMLAENDDQRDRVLVLVTDGQVGNEDQILREVSEGLRQVRVHTVGIDTAVNAGFLGRLASLGGGRCELVESENRLDEAMERIHRRIGSPRVTRVEVDERGITTIEGTRAPSRLPEIFSGVPYVIRGRYAGGTDGTMTLKGRRPDGKPWEVTARAHRCASAALTPVWARAHLREREDEFITSGMTASADISQQYEKKIVDISLCFGVLCRFTAYVVVDTRVVAGKGPVVSIVQPVESPQGWQMGVSTTAIPVSYAAPMAAGMSVPMPVQPCCVPRSEEGAVMGMIQSKIGRARPDESSTPKNDRDEFRQRMAMEAERLRQSSSTPWYQRRDLLEDLGTRLVVILREGCDDAPVRELVESLRSDRLEETCGDESSLQHLWDHVLGLLDILASAGQVSASPKPETSSRRRSFWKR